MDDVSADWTENHPTESADKSGMYTQLQQQSYSVFKSLLPAPIKKKDKETLKISGNNVDFKLKLHHLSSKYNKVQTTEQVFKKLKSLFVPYVGFFVAKWLSWGAFTPAV